MKICFFEFVSREHLIAEGQRVLLAVSGGRDSVTLAHLMHECGYEFAIAHCNFHLRESDSDRDERFVRSLAERYGVKCHVAQFYTAKYAAERHLSIEEAAREQRYAYFDEICKVEGYDLIATAHHRDDSIETFFINLLRGTGIHGLCGIPVRRGNIIRPLLCFGRDDINRYVSENGLQYVEDYTNSEAVYLRNRIRLQLMPLMRQLSSGFDVTMQRNIKWLRAAAAVYDAAIEERREHLVVEASQIKIPIRYIENDVSPETVLYELLNPYGFTGETVAMIIASLGGQSGRRFYSSTHCVIKDREDLILVPLSYGYEEDTYVLTADGVLEGIPSIGITAEIVSDFAPCTKHEALFDYDKLRFPLLVRRWRKGDRFRPYGMKGSRLVSDLMSDYKMSLVDKRRAWLMSDREGEILWVVGLRAAAVATVESGTVRMLRMRLLESDESIVS